MARKYGRKTSETVERALHKFKRGTLKGSRGGKVRTRAQALAIGLSEARRKGYKIPPAPSKGSRSPRRGPRKKGKSGNRTRRGWSTGWRLRDGA